MLLDIYMKRYEKHERVKHVKHDEDEGIAMGFMILFDTQSQSQQKQF